MSDGSCLVWSGLLEYFLWLGRPVDFRSVCYLSNNLRFPSSSLVVVSLCLDMEPSFAELLIFLFKEKMACDALQGQSDDYEMQMPPV